MITVTVQIGNTDDKLSQNRWSDFCVSVHRALEGMQSDGDLQMHFSGFARPDAPWQNACWVACVESIAEVATLKQLMRARVKQFDQESIAVTIGETDFVEGSL